MATTIPILGTFGGLGATTVHDPQSGRYTITTNATTRFGFMTAGLLEEADHSGIDAGYYTLKQIKYVSYDGTEYQIRLTTNGSATRIYHRANGLTAWTNFSKAIAPFTTAVATDVVSFYSAEAASAILIVGFGTSGVWQFTRALAAGSWTNNEQGAASRAEYMTKAHVQETGLSQARLVWAVSPSPSVADMKGVELYTVTDVTISTDIPTGPVAETGPTTIAPFGGDYVTSITENDLGDLFVGTRNRLYGFDDAGLPVVVAGPFADPPTDAGGTSDRRNFETYAQLPDSSLLYVVEGYDLVRVRSAADPQTVREQRYAPRSSVDTPGGLPRVNLPISAVVRAGEWVVCALTANTASITLANQPGGTALLQNAITNGVSEIYVGKLVDDRLVWWGSELATFDRLRYLYYDAYDSYLWLYGGDDNAARRCKFFLDDPYTRLVGGSIKLSAGTPSVEFAPLDIDGEYQPKGAGLITIDAQSLTSTSTCTVAIRPQPDYDTSTAFTTLAVYSSAAIAERGTHVGRSTTFDRLRVRVTLGTGSGTAFPRFNGGAVTLHPLRERQAVGAI